MNALDKAFIKAFAKNRVPSTVEPQRAKPHIDLPSTQPEVETAQVVLHDTRDDGKRLRVDRPEADAVVLDAHMILPLVEQVQSYDPEHVEDQTLPSVLFEDRLSDLQQDASSQRPDDASAPDRSAPPTSEKGERSSDEPVSDKRMPAERTSDENDLANHSESNVTERTDANADREVQALDSPSIEQQIWEFCQPQSLTVTQQAAVLDLWSVQHSHLSTSAELPSLDFDMKVEVHGPQIDWDALEQVVGNDPSVPATAQQPVAAGLPPAAESAASPEPAPEPALEPAPESVPLSAAKPAVSEASTRASSLAVEEEIFLAQAVSASIPVEDQPCCLPDSRVEVSVFDPAELTVEASQESASDQGAQQAPQAAPREGVTESVTPSFAPAWEVDAFRWPSLCQELDQQTQGRLTQSGEELCLATREGLRVVAVTSSQREEGRSTLALSLARSAARAGAVWPWLMEMRRSRIWRVAWGWKLLATGAKYSAAASR